MSEENEFGRTKFSKRFNKNKQKTEFSKRFYGERIPVKNEVDTVQDEETQNLPDDTGESTEESD